MTLRQSDLRSGSGEIRLPVRKAVVVWTLGSLLGWAIVYLVASIVLEL